MQLPGSEEGMAPTGPNPQYVDAYGRMAPMGTYPADVSGNIKRLQELYLEGPTIAEHTPARRLYSLTQTGVK